MGRHFLRVAWLFLAISWAAPSAVDAQRREPTEDEIAEARAIFAEGVAHADRAEWHEAVICFRQVLEVRDAPPVLYNLAAALVELHNFQEAEPLLRRVIADESAEASLVERSNHLLTEMAARGGRVRIQLVGTLPGATIWVDSVPIAPARLEGDIAVSAGVHVVVVRVGSSDRVRRPFEIAAGQRLDLAVVLTPEAGTGPTSDTETPGVGPVAGTGDVVTDAPPRRRAVRSPWLWAGVGGGVAVVVIVTVVAVSAGGTRPGYTGDFAPGNVGF